jgi:hypothetical protein
MGLSVAISGGIVLTVFVIMLFSLPGLADKMFSIGDITTQVTQHQQEISKTDISLETLFATSGSPNVNFTLNNDDTEKLWNFEKFNVIVEYENASGDDLEELSFGGTCSGVLPAIGNWCIESISGDFLDEGILNEGESAQIWTRVSQNLVSGNARVSVSTDNGETAMLPAPKRSWFDATPIPPVTCEFENYGRTFQDTDTGITYVCDSTRDKWLSVETLTLFGEETASCAAGADPNSSPNCNVDWGDTLGPDATTDQGLYLPYDATIIAYGFSEDNDACATGAGVDIEIWNTGSNVNDNAFALEQEVATGLNGQAHNANNLDVDILGDDYKLWGIDNNCGEAIDDFNIILYVKWRHD